MSNEKRFYTVSEAAGSLGMGRTWLYKQMQQGHLRSMKVDGRRLIPASCLDEFAAYLIAEHQVS